MTFIFGGKELLLSLLNITAKTNCKLNFEIVVEVPFSGANKSCEEENKQLGLQSMCLVSTLKKKFLIFMLRPHCCVQF